MTMGCHCHNVKFDAIVLADDSPARLTYRITMHGYLVGPGYVHTIDDVAAARPGRPLQRQT